jgi:hypothetical protein
VGWLKAEDQTILTLHNRVVTHNSRISVAHDNLRTWQLRIRQLRESDRGCYMCQINTSTMKKQLGCIDVHGESLTFGSSIYYFLAVDSFVGGKPISRVIPSIFNLPQRLQRSSSTQSLHFD